MSALSGNVLFLTRSMVINTNGHQVQVAGLPTPVTVSGDGILDLIDTTGWDRLDLEADAFVVPNGYKFVLIGPEPLTS